MKATTSIILDLKLLVLHTNKILKASMATRKVEIYLLKMLLLVSMPRLLKSLLPQAPDPPIFPTMTRSWMPTTRRVSHYCQLLSRRTRPSSRWLESSSIPSSRSSFQRSTPPRSLVCSLTSLLRRSSSTSKTSTDSTWRSVRQSAFFNRWLLLLRFRLERNF